MSERESMQYDVVIVGAGPAGLSAAIRLKQLASDAGRDVAVCVLEKGSEVGAHILSGAVIDPKALDELIPDWKDKGAPLTVPVSENHHWVLTKSGKWAIPHLALPPFMHNKGTFTLSLGNLCRWLAGQAEELGVEIFPGFAAAEVLFNDDGSRQRGRDRRHGRGARRHQTSRLPAGNRTPCPLHVPRGRRARSPDQGSHPAVRPSR